MVVQLEKMEISEKQLQAQLVQNKYIMLQQSKKLQQVYGTTGMLKGPHENEKTETIEKEKNNEHLLCPICLEKQKNVALDACGHTLCKGCASMILSTPNKKCPICRKHVKSANPFYL